MNEIHLLLGSLAETVADSSERHLLAKGRHHFAISSFVKSFDAKSYLAIYGVSEENSNIGPDFISHYNRLIGLEQDPKGLFEEDSEVVRHHVCFVFLDVWH